MVFLLFVVIFIEGYVVLASELLAIRLIISWVGSGTEVISIIIAAVLMPLAFGYYFGGQFGGACRKKGLLARAVRQKLVFNLKVAVLVLSLGLSYMVLDVFFTALYSYGVSSRLMQTMLYAGIFIVCPVFLLGQTIPLISHYFSRSSLSEMTGRMLMFSTLGSFFGSIFSTVILMSLVGVHYTVIFVIFLLCSLILLMHRKRDYESVLFVLCVFAFTYYINSGVQMRYLDIVNNNAYNTVQVVDFPGKENTRIMALNRNFSSSYKEGEGSIYNYANYVHTSFIDPLQPPLSPKSILVVGAAGFTIGLDDTYNDYTFIDIDPDLKKIAENDFLKRKLTDNKKFEPVAARGFLVQAAKSGKQYDLIVLDTFKAGFSMPEHLLTREYFQQVEQVLKPGGYVVINTVSAGNFTGRFSKRLDNTIRSVFPHVTRAVMTGEGDDYNAWASARNEQGLYISNAIYSYYKDPDGDHDMTIYTDDKNTYFLDK